MVNPIKFGSYENVNILRALKEHDFEFNLSDSSGRTPITYANE